MSFLNKKRITQSAKAKYFKKSDGSFVNIKNWQNKISLVFVLLLVCSTLSGLFTFPVHAVNDATVAGRAEAYSYYLAFKECLNGGSQYAAMSPQSAETGSWFSYDPAYNMSYISPSSNVGVFATGSNDSTTCNDVMKKVAEYTGYSSYGVTSDSFLCAIMGDHWRKDGDENSGTCVSGSGSNINHFERFTENFDNLFLEKYFQKSSLSDSEIKAYQYKAFFGAFTIYQGCNASETEYSKADFNHDEYYYEDVKFVNTDTHEVITSNWANKSTGWGNASRDTLRNVDPDHSSQKCSSIADQLSSLAEDYALYLQNNPDEIDGGGDSGSADASKSTCDVNGIGWLLCPIVNFLSSIADAFLNGLKDNFLNLDTGLANTGGPTYQAWNAVRGIANILFVIVFLLMIVSQMTSFKLADFGVQKMLPRLVVFALLVNLSFYICQICVDLSNIVGNSLYGFFNGIPIGGDATNTTTVGDSTNGNSVWGTNGVFSGIAATVLVAGTAGAVMYFALGTFITVVLTVVLILIMTLLILILRKAAVVLAIVLAPIAILACLLPNTEGLFQKWKKIFLALLLVYPIIGLIYGASNLASTILQGTFDNMGDNMGGILGAALQVVPLIAVPFVLMKSLDSIGNISGKLNGLRGKMTGGLKTNLKGFNRPSTIKEGLAYRQKQLDIKRRTARGGRADSKGWSRIYGAVGGKKYNDRLAAEGVTLAAAQDKEALEGEQLRMMALRDNSSGVEQKLSQEQLTTLAAGGSVDFAGKTLNGANELTRRAAINEAMKFGQAEDAEAIMDSMGGASQSVRDSALAAIATSSVVKKAPWLAENFGAAAKGTASSGSTRAAILKAATEGRITGDQLARADQKAIQHLHDVLKPTLNSLSPGFVGPVDPRATTIIQNIEAARVQIARTPELAAMANPELGNLLK